MSAATSSDRNGVFDPGDQTQVLADIFPASVRPMPAGVPAGMKIRAIVTRDSLTVAWLAGRQGLEPIIGRVDVLLSPEQVAGVTHLGGQAGEYFVERGPGCSCGAAGLKNWHPFPDVVLLGTTPYRENTGAFTGKYSRS